MNTQVEILVNGKPIKQYQHNGKTFIEARIGTEYTIKVKNSSCFRKLAVITVDGLNVITGNPYTSNSDNQGYIVSPYDAIEIRGFRKDMNSVGAFKFCQSGHSYCNEKGLKGNNGVIGVRIYDERNNWTTSINEIEKINQQNKPQKPQIDPWDIKPWKLSDLDSTDATKGYNNIDYTNNYYSSAVTCSTSSPEFDVGTTWGKQINDKVVNSTFDINENIFIDYVFYYDTKKNLEKIGIKFIKEKSVYYPSAFGTFAKPPKNWKS